MQWEELTSDNFAKAVVECKGVCLLSLGVMERHGPHMPLGTDMFIGQHICNQAALQEQAVVFPPWFIGQIYEAKCFPGTVTIPPRLLLELMLSIFDEIGRNGFTKIVTFIAHGGNNFLARFLAQCQLDQPKPYQVYAFDYWGGMSAQEKATWKQCLVTDGGGHAGESETSSVLAVRPDLVRMDAVGQRSGEAQGKMKHVNAGFSGWGWYGDFPTHWSGDARPATVEKGKILLGAQVEALVRFVKAVKNDAATPALAEEFWRKEASIRS